MITAATAIFIAGFSSIFTGLNFIVRSTMRCPGMTWFRMPLFVWSHYAASLLMVLGTPVLAITLVLVALERLFGIGVFDPTKGGDPLLFQHLFWFYSHPAVYIMILPGMGVISEAISMFSRKARLRICGFPPSVRWRLRCSVSLCGSTTCSSWVFPCTPRWSFRCDHAGRGTLGDQDIQLGVYMQKGSITFDTPMLYAFGFMGLFTIGGLTGVFLGSLGMDIHLTETVLYRCPLPLCDGRRHADGVPCGRPFLVAEDDGAHVSGVAFKAGCGDHFHRVQPDVPPTIYSWLHGNAAALSCVSAGVPSAERVVHCRRHGLGVGYMLPMLYLAWSLKYGAIAGDNPWQATGLEWQIQSPPLTENFIEIPIMDHEAYDYEWLQNKTKKEVTTVG